jgi:hypothetical protein
MASGGGGFDDIFDRLREIQEDLVSINADAVLMGERLKMLEERAEPGEGGGDSAQAQEDERVPGLAVSWKDLSREERDALWTEFVVWVLWLADRYEVTNDQLPRDCWWMHGAVVEELTALWTSHQSAYATEEDAGSAPYLWQDAWSRAIERIGRLWLGGTCRNGQHRPRHRQPWIGDEPYLDQILLYRALARHRNKPTDRSAEASADTAEGPDPGPGEESGRPLPDEADEPDAPDEH